MSESSSVRDKAGLLVAALYPSVAAWLYFVTFADAPFMPAVYAICKVAQFSFPLLWLSFNRLERPDRATPISEGLIPGALSGLAIVVLMWAVYVMVIEGSGLARAAQPAIEARIVAMGVATPIRFIALTLFISVVHSFLEEYYWRWFVYGRMRAWLGGPSAMLMSSAAFAAHHVIVLHAFIGHSPYWWITVPLTIAVALGGALWAWLYARSGSLLSPWLSHTLVDLGIMVIGYDLAGS